MNEILWFLSRATGAVSVATLTVVVVLGLVTASRRRPRGIRSAVVMGLHRSLSLGASVFLVVHVATAILETYVSIGWISAIVPFTASYQRAWVGLGTIAVDLAAAIIITSLLRHRLPERVWKGVHLTAFAFWPIAVVHGIAMGTSDEPILRGITIGCAAAGATALGWRLFATDPDTEKRRTVALQEWS
ncbi:MAG TPA: ferric reductase-like transmembrane domain-containing protein [Dermatophilaceae bacterium]|nr:ferric reductase-like transmembrane domain-containing protein [Dermatophilaceae bacterium]